ncbi:hypothetical protein PIB30_070727 [Stylosanthes scabra]|uniref:Uncharacterized protein n=1 Tax=Stylosanthes scabra TaxID=79078 RepID=A0ABU6VM64_9FABA|nr:hypothetical protein [Stylosanthes scabra]
MATTVVRRKSFHIRTLNGNKETFPKNYSRSYLEREAISGRQEDKVLAVTLRSGKQLERPPLTTHHIPPETSRKVDIQHGEGNIQDTPEAVTTNPRQTTNEDRRPTSL